jgi:ribonucleoside-triphosphate reductase
MLTGYCAGWSLKQLIQEGLGGVTGKITSAPASHLSTLCCQMVNFLGIMQNEWAGAQAFSSFDTYLAPFVKVDNLTQKDVKQCIQSFVYGVNTPSRWGTQAPFSNITLDWTVPNDLKDMPAIVGGKEMDFTYGDCKKEMDMINKAFIEIMIEGDANGRGFQYPIPTYSITSDFDWSETENNKRLFSVSDQSKSLVIEYVGIGYWKPRPLASPSNIISMNALLTISISLTQSLYLNFCSTPPTKQFISAKSAGTVQSNVIFVNGA